MLFIIALQSDGIVGTESQHYTKEETLALSPTAYHPSSSLHILFLDVIDQIEELIQPYDAAFVTEACKSLKASEARRINLFSESQIKNLSDYRGNTALLLRLLSFLFTWCDHSILREVVSFSNEAIQLLDEFDSFLDPFNTIVSYPICMFSLSMVPSEDSPYTLLAIRCNKELWQCSLQYVFNIRSTLVELCEITQHCLQLLAVQSDPTMFYWNIPRSVVTLISTNILKHIEYLCSQEIVEMVVFPKQRLFTVHDVAVGSQAFVTEERIDTNEVCILCKEVKITVCQL